MTTNIIKDIGSKCDIKFEGLGDPGPFSYAIVDGTVPTGTTFNQSTGELKGTFAEQGEFNVTISCKKKDRIEGQNDFKFIVSS